MIRLMRDEIVPAAAVAVLSVAAWGVAATDTPVAHAAVYRVVGTGDSILSSVAESGRLDSPYRWIDTEPGRQAYTPGIEGRQSTASIWPTVLASSRRGGWVIIQDNALGVSEAGWRALLARIVDELPDDRCLVGILPVYHPNWSTGYHQLTARMARIMVEEVTRQPCWQLIWWNNAVLADPSLVTDGQHPSAKGDAWLAAWIDWVTGPRA